TAALAIPQASLLPFSISATVMLAFPLASSWMVNGAAQFATGATLSSTVTIVVQVEVFPFTSVTVKVTVFGPTSAQVKSVRSIEVLAIPQASVLPFSISATVMLAFPLASSWMVNGAAQFAMGATLSSTVTIVVQVETLPFTSLTVKVTVFGPTSAQVKAVMSIEVLAIPQASVLPLSISATVILASPLASSWIVKSAAQFATGATLSSTVTTVVQVETLPFTSVTVKVTVFGPTSAQVKAVMSIEVLAIPQASVLPLSISATVI